MMRHAYRPALIGHRGYPRRFPENTLAGIAGALEAGADGVEFDVQLSADGVPVVVHDESLSRTTGRDALVTEMAGGALADGLNLPTLAGVMTLLERWPGAPAFVELKRESLRRFGVQTMVRAVLDVLGPAVGRCVLISFDQDAVVVARERGASAVGWVIDAWSDGVREQAAALTPSYLVCDETLVPRAPRSLWTGTWQWVVYGVNDADVALRLGARGVTFVETDAVGELRAHPAFSAGEVPTDA